MTDEEKVKAIYGDAYLVESKDKPTRFQAMRCGYMGRTPAGLAVGRLMDTPEDAWADAARKLDGAQ